MAGDQPINVLRALTLLLCCQLAGEAIVSTLHAAFPIITFPGPVIGMALLFLFLIWRGGVGPNIAATGNGILRNLSLLFVPATVGIIQQGPLLRQYGIVLLVALLVSVVLTLIVTASVFQFLAKRMNIGDNDEL